MSTGTIEGYHLSPLQKHLWLLQQDENAGPYRAECAILIEGDLDTKMLKSAIDEVVSRHEIFRTSIRRLPGMTVPLQVIADAGMSLYDYYDLSGCPGQEQEQGMQELFQKVRQSGFDLENGPPLRASLIKLSAERHMLQILLPGLCADAGSLKNLVSEISCLYGSGSGNELCREPMQYADLSEWQNDLFEAEETEAGRGYWRKQDISNALSLELPFEKHEQAGATFTPLVLRKRIEAGANIERLAQKYHTTARVFLLTCWQTLLWHFTRGSEVTVGVAFDGRNYQELEGAMGLFAKYLPVSAHLEDADRFTDLMMSVDNAISEADKWQECFNWDEIIAQGREAGGAFFPVCFEYQGGAVKFSAGAVTFSISQQYACIDRFKIKLCCNQADNVLCCEFHYDSSLLRAEDVERLAGEFNALVESAIDNPESAISDLEMLTDSERHQLLIDFNQTGADYPEGECVHQRFEEQVKSTPDDIAVVFEDEKLTYAELNRRANWLGSHLRSLGIGPEVLVATCVERSADMMIGLLGVLKAGGAYVPLDPALPKDRLAFMLENTQAPVLLTHRRLLDRLPRVEARVICLDADLPTTAENSGGDLNSQPLAQNLAYVIYTSGSTGKPKGVAIEHRQLLNYIDGITTILGVDPGSSFATVSTFAADLGNTVIFPSISTGGCLHLISQQRASDPEALADYFERHSIDCLKIVPSHLAALLVPANSGRVLPRRRLILGGDVTRWSLIEKIEQVTPDCDIINHYGPTETTVGVLTYRLKRGEADRLSVTLPLGQPISNTQAYILNSKLRPLPIFAAGEVYIGGAGLGRGYLNSPDLTADRFVPNPFSKVGGERLYKTGDLARYLPDGNIEFLGRADNQVKIRGYRVELGEIEAALCQHPAVRQAVVIADEYTSGDKRLLAYIVPAEQPGLAADELSGFLKEKLPDHMLPSNFVTLSHLPLTPNGKIDRRALPLPERTQAVASAYAPPRNEMENILTTIWQKVLGRRAIGIHDNYFSLGGDSIRVIQIVHELRRLGFLVTALNVLRNPTVYKLGSYISSGRQDSAKDAPPLHLIKLPDQILNSLPGDVEDAYPLSRMQRFILDHYSNDHQNSGVYHIQHSSHMYDESLSVAALKRALRVLVQRHPALRTAFLLEGYPLQLQVVKKQVEFSIEEDVIKHLDAGEQEIYVERAMMEDRRNLFDAGNVNEPLFRFRIMLRSENSVEFLMSAHHAITDGWGNIELERELFELYLSIKNGVEPGTPPSPNVFKEFIALEQEIISSPAASDFWKEHLTDHSYRPPAKKASVTDASAANEVRNLDTEMISGLQALSQGERVSLKAIFLSAYLDLVASLSNQNVITVGVVSNGRSERLSDPLKALGLFWNIAPFCCRTEPTDKLAQIKAVQELLISIEPYVRYPLPQILDDRGESELFFATFNFLHFHNARDVSIGTGIKALGSRAHDKFHFPLNYVVAVDPIDQQISLRVEYNQIYFSSQLMRSMIDDYASLLRDLSQLKLQS